SRIFSISLLARSRPSLSFTFTVPSSRLTLTFSTSARAPSFFWLPSAQNEQTMPLAWAVTSTARAAGAATQLRATIIKNDFFMRNTFPSKVEHGIERRDAYEAPADLPENVSVIEPSQRRDRVFFDQPRMILVLNHQPRPKL